MTVMEPAVRKTLLDSLTDEEVVRRVLAGEEPLFELIMRRHNQRLYRAVRAIMRDDAEAEDVMQQAYVNAYTNLAQFAGNAKFSTWLIRIGVHEALARVRRNRLVVVESDCGEPCEQQIQAAPSREPDPEEGSMNRELQGVLEREILALPESYRVVFMLREVDGSSTEETAECLGVSTDVVKTRLHRARGLLRDALMTRAGVTLESVFGFYEPRCDRVVQAVLSRIAEPVR